MKQELKTKQALFPLPVALIATYGEDGRVDCMTAAWVTYADYSKILVVLDPHRTTENLKARKAFTISPTPKRLWKESDYFGTVSQNQVPDKFARTGLHAKKAEKVDAPLIEEYPLSMECSLVSLEGNDKDGYTLVGAIERVVCDDSVLTDGKIDVRKLEPVTFNGASVEYDAVTEVVGRAYSNRNAF